MSQLNCPHCAQPYDITPDQWPQYAGRNINCTRCGQPFMVTGSESSPMAAPAPAMAQHAGGAGYVPAAGHGPPGPGAPAYGVPPYGAPGYAGGYYAPRKGMSGWLIAVLIVGAVLAVPTLIAILLPSLNRAREQANRAKCANNIRQIAQACQMYASANNGQYPPTINLVLETDDLPSTVFICPTSNDTEAAGATTEARAADLTAGGHLSYVYVGDKLPSRIANPSRTVLLYEPMSNHASKGANFAFVDGHVEFFTERDAQRMIRDLELGRNPPAVGASGQ